MRKLLALPFLTFALACSDGTPLQPHEDLVGTPGQPAPEALLATSGNQKWEFTRQSNYWGPVEPGDLRVNAGGVWHAAGLINEFDVTGELAGEPVEGFQCFIGDYVWNLDNGKG